MSEEIKNGTYEEYYDNGQLLAKCTYKDGVEDGPYEEYYENGQLWEKCTYKDGKLDGPYETYHQNGQLWEKGTYKDGWKDGLHEYYYSDGTSTERFYKDGIEVTEEEYNRLTQNEITPVKVATHSESMTALREANQR